MIDQLKINPAAGRVLKEKYSELRRIRMGSYQIGYEGMKRTMRKAVIELDFDLNNTLERQ